MIERNPINKRVQVIKKDYQNLPMNHRSIVFVSEGKNGELVEWFQDNWGGFILVENHLLNGVIEYI